MSDPMSLALAKLDEAMRPGLGGGADPARRRCAQRLAQLARCGDEELPAFAKRHMPGREIEGSELRAARDLLLVIDGIADLEDGGPGAWAALAEVKELLERRIATAKEEAQKRKAEEEAAALDDESTVAGEVHIPAPEPHPFHAAENQTPLARPVEPARTWEPAVEPPRTWEPAVEPPTAVPNPMPPPLRPASRLGSTADAPHGLPLPPLPFRATKPNAAEEPARAENRPAREEPPEMTMAVRLPIREKAALPFAGPATPLPPESRARAPEAPRLDPKRSPIASKQPVVEDLDEPTGTTEELLGATGKIRAIKGPVLPFRASLPGPAATPPASSPAPPDDEGPEEATGKVQAVKGHVLPFRPSLLGLEAAPPPSSPGPPADSTPRAQPASVGPQTAANPGPPSAPSIAAGPQTAPGVSALVPEPQKQLSISQYASLCAELTVFPEAAEGIFRRYGLDDDEKRSAVDAAWKERLRLDRAEYNQWLDLYQRYRALWKQHG